MPPKAKFTRDEIIEKALDIVHTEGIDRLTSRELGAQLGSSARPIFTVFESMDEVKLEVIRHARELYRQYVDRGLKARLAFQGVGVAYITFALEEPKLFQLLFMNAQTTKDDAGEAVSVNVSQILPLIDDSYEKILRSVQEPYGLDRQTADRLYQHLWIYTHGIAAMCATRLCNYTMEQMKEMMKEVFDGLLFRIKNEQQSNTLQQADGE
ncbi:MAG: TetR/AcrR family transcriptional regulator [Lachnospiraceae bacterium]|jgi:AcrR family transcriptional regulator|nr:TetR/AcrR family transcriptional regulator [Lachnospiraceae bacterium]